ncbi:MAG: hypothetical protein DMG98_08240 [Acidobacteria bacterium]|nr:MAG: hypothetical protein DMG98_08240 [Acidobacteriota bacterium]
MRLNIENSAFRVRSGQERRKISRPADRRKGTNGRAPANSRTSTFISVTVSIGVAESRSKASMDEIIEEADQALYRAKKGGRNRIEITAPPKQTKPIRSKRAVRR